MLVLTYGLVGYQRLVIKTKNLGDVVEIWMLNCKGPKGVVHPVIEICYGDLYSPIVLIVDLHMPMYPYRAHVMSTL